MTPPIIRVFIGYDDKERPAFHVLAHSILRRASVPVAIIGLRRQALSMYWRKRGPTESTEFSMTRFLVPALCNYTGWALFMDCDMMARADIAELWDLRDPNAAVMCVKHDYEPSTERKMRGAVQTRYEKKNWSSLMLFNCSEWCEKLTVPYVNEASGLDLHQFKWLPNEAKIGELPQEWNHLVGESEYDPDAKIVHWTLGGPWWAEFADTDYADEWYGMRAHMLQDT